MPVVIEKIVQPSAQDLIDLEKIYLDYPTPFRYADMQNLLAQHADIHLYGARFNGRILAAITVQSQAQGCELNYFCTRIVTRQRGVGKELLRQLLPLLNKQPVHMTLCEASAGMQHLLRQNGFSQNDWHFSLQL
jgi:hypothetical protein